MKSCAPASLPPSAVREDDWGRGRWVGGLISGSNCVSTICGNLRGCAGLEQVGGSACSLEAHNNTQHARECVWGARINSLLARACRVCLPLRSAARLPLERGLLPNLEKYSTTLNKQNSATFFQILFWILSFRVCNTVAVGAGGRRPAYLVNQSNRYTNLCGILLTAAKSSLPWIAFRRRPRRRSRLKHPSSDWPRPRPWSGGAMRRGFLHVGK